jgi:hypothetical protein
MQSVSKNIERESTMYKKEDPELVKKVATCELKPELLWQTAAGSWKAQVLASAIDIGLFDFLNKESNKGFTKEEITKELGIKISRPEDFLNALVSIGHLTRTEDRYRNTPETAAFCVKSSPLYTGDAFTRFGNLNESNFGTLTDHLIKDPTPRFSNFNEVYTSD